MITAGKADDITASGKGFRQLNRRFGRIRTGRAAKLQAVFVFPAGEIRQQRLGKRVFQGGGNVQRVQGQAAGQCVLNTLDDCRVIMTQSQRTRSGQTVEIFVALDIRYPATLSLGNG